MASLDQFGRMLLECYPVVKPYVSYVYCENGRHDVMHEYSRGAWGRKFYGMLPKIIRNIDEISSESRMFLCPVPISQRMEAVGYERRLRHQITLGVLIDFHSHPEARTQEGNLIIDFSDSQIVTAVNDEGEVFYDNHALYPIEDVWRIFVEVSGKYAEKYCKYLHYTLKDIDLMFRT